ncbi:MAG TPA: hypothetical protein VJG90_07570 [Candidatus Nanoarchaeia archaeon]|nr:hypothetical protein [Candidatus Nanoarchaeia archaeon]
MTKKRYHYPGDMYTYKDKKVPLFVYKIQFEDLTCNEITQRNQERCLSLAAVTIESLVNQTSGLFLDQSDGRFRLDLKEVQVVRQSGIKVRKNPSISYYTLKAVDRLRPGPEGFKMVITSELDPITAVVKDFFGALLELNYGNRDIAPLGGGIGEYQDSGFCLLPYNSVVPGQAEFPHKGMYTHLAHEVLHGLIGLGHCQGLSCLLQEMEMGSHFGLCVAGSKLLGWKKKKPLDLRV